MQVIVTGGPSYEPIDQVRRLTNFSTGELGGMRVPISVDGRKRQWVRLDTGCATAFQWVTSDVRPEQCERRRMAIGLAELSIPQVETTVGIAGHEFQKVPTGLHEAAIFPGECGLPGDGLLSRFSTVTIDAKAGRVILGKPVAE